MKQTNAQTVPRARAAGGGLAGLAVLAMVVTAGLAGCAHRVTVDPIKVEPIHLTLDITLKVDRELDRFFDYEEPASAAPPAAAGNGGAS